MTIRYAAHTGNMHCSIRVTPFFDTIAEARAAGDATDHDQTVVKPTANWEEHQRWNQQRVGNYASCPVIE